MQLKESKGTRLTLPGMLLEVAISLLLLPPIASAQAVNPYHLVQNWPQVPPGEAIGSVSWVAIPRGFSMHSDDVLSYPCV
jgi:hypothetical protein